MLASGLFCAGTGRSRSLGGPGATFVHNWLALLFVVVITGHVLMALADRDALKAMLFGRISRAWARRHAPAWLDEIEADDEAPDALARTSTGGNEQRGRGPGL